MHNPMLHLTASMSETALRATRLTAEFERRFASNPILVRAPGRVNLIGEHTDYNDGFVMPAAIGFHAWTAIAPREDHRFVAHSLQFPEILDAPTDATGTRAGKWTDYCWGVFQTLRNAGLVQRGASLLVDGDVPIGAGLSSSAAIEVATAFALVTASGATPDLVGLAKLCQRAENEFVGARCGIMDQFIGCMGRAGQAIVLDCRSLQYRYVSLPRGVSLVICNTMVKHSIAGGEYNQRRAECEQAVSLLHAKLPGIRALRDVTPQDLDAHRASLPEKIYRRARHVVSENVRVLDAEAALQAGDLRTLGALMRASYESLRDDYEVSCPELDAMIELAQRQPGAVACRITGGGFGGCTVNLVRTEAVEDFRHAIAEAYERQTHLKPEIYVAAVSQGVHRLA